MRTPIPVLAALFLTTALGCSVMDDIDEAHTAMKITRGRTPAKQGIDWTVSRSINTGQVDPSIIRCKLVGTTLFMREDDCLSRGGTPNKI